MNLEEYVRLSCRVSRLFPRLLGAVPKTDMVARLAGDEFVVMREGRHDAEGPHQKADGLLAVLRAHLKHSA